MGYIVSAYAVPLARVRTAVGSGDADLLHVLTVPAASRHGRIDLEDEDLYDPDGGESPVATMVAVLRHLVAGEARDERVGFKYGYALELLCRHLGQPLPNERWSALRWEWLEQIDESLAAAGVSAEVFRVTRHLVCPGAPMPLPRIEDFPSIGYLTVSEIPAVATALRSPRVAEIGDEEVRESLAELSGWLRACADSGRDLICFYG